MSEEPDSDHQDNPSGRFAWGKMNGLRIMALLLLVGGMGFWKSFALRNTYAAVHHGRVEAAAEPADTTWYTSLEEAWASEGAVRHLRLDREDFARAGDAFWDSLYGLTSLRKLRLAISTDALPPGISALTDLVELDISDIGLWVAPEGLEQLKHLRYLDLSGNFCLADQLEFLAELKQLVVLKLGQMGLEKMPDVLCELPQLRMLDLSKNGMAELAPCIGQLSELTTLRINNNHLPALPPEIGQLQRLKTLWLINNPLAHVPPEFGKLAALQFCWVQDQPGLEREVKALLPHIRFSSGRN